MQYRDSRQDATGLIVNKKLNIPVEYYKDTRAMCHRLFVEGKSFQIFNGNQKPLSTESLRGRLNFIYYIRGLTDKKAPPDKNRRHPAYHRLYTRFLNYMSFWSIQQPLIVCEGKTDGIYIRSAIRSLRGKFPAFYKFVDGKEKLRPTFFKYTNVAKSVQDLSGGNGQLKNLVHQFGQRTKGFKGTPMAPVIVITDVDKGAADLFKAMGRILNKVVTGDEPWYYLHTNLYVVPVPKLATPERAIEDLFTKELLETKIEGKSFDRTNHEEDGAKFYSKFTFATKIVAAAKVPINFSGFEPLLQAILDVESDYSMRLSATPANINPAP